MPLFWTLAPLSLAIVAVTLGWTTWGGHVQDLTTPVRVLSGLLVAASLITAAAGPWGRALRLRLVVLVGTLAIVTMLLGLRAVGRWPFAWDGFGHAGYAGFLALTMLAATGGVARGALWGRWIALTFAFAALGCGALNAFWLFDRHDEWSWMPVLSTLCGALLCLLLFHPSVRARSGPRRVDRADDLWASTDLVIRVARSAAIANMLAMPMLLVYAIVQPVVAATVMSAYGLVPLLGLGSALVVRRKVAGVLVLGLGGVLLAAQTIVTVASVQSAQLHTALYYAAFWTPAAILGAVAAALVLWRARADR